MIKRTLLFLLIIYSSSILAINIEYPKLFLTVGYPYISMQSNVPESGRDFLAISFGASMEYDLTSKSTINVLIDATFTPDRKNILIDPNGRELSGSSSLLTSYYSLAYSYLFKSLNEDNFFFSFGPTIGLHTLDFDQFEENNTIVKTKNRVRMRNYGARVSFKKKDKESKNYWEIAYYYLINNKYTVIDDASNDAQAITKNSSVANDISWSIFINYGMRIF